MSAENRRIETEDAIIRTLMRAGPLESGKWELSWTELLQQSGVSRRALNLRLRSMEKRGLIRRRVDSSSQKYPPPVYYRLVPTNSKVEQILSQQQAYDRTVEKELTFEESPEEFVQKLTAKVPPIVIYAILKSLESGSRRPAAETLEQLLFTLKKFLVYKQPFDQSDLKQLGRKFGEVDQKPERFKTEIEYLLETLRHRFPEETATIDEVYLERVKPEVDRGPSLNPRGRPKKSATSQKGNAT